MKQFKALCYHFAISYLISDIFCFLLVKSTNIGFSLMIGTTAVILKPIILHLCRK